MCARAEAHVVRLALLYALSDEQTTINLAHLNAALALWDYATRSAAWALADATGDAVAEQIHAALLGACCRHRLQCPFPREATPLRRFHSCALPHPEAGVNVERPQAEGRGRTTLTPAGGCGT